MTDLFFKIGKGNFQSLTEITILYYTLQSHFLMINLHSLIFSKFFILLYLANSFLTMRYYTSLNKLDTIFNIFLSLFKQKYMEGTEEWEHY